MIDWQQLQDLKSDLGDGFDELVEVFLAEVEEGMERLDSATDNAELAAGLHFLKGAALNLGFSTFGALCAEGENRAIAGEPVELAPIRSSLDASRAEFLKGLAERRVA